MFRVLMTLATLLILAVNSMAAVPYDKFREAGIPDSLAAWIIDVQTPGMAYYPPPRPLPAPTGDGEFMRRNGLPTWNGMIGGEKGVPNNDAAPRGTLLIAKGSGAFILRLSNGPDANELAVKSSGCQCQPCTCVDCSCEVGRKRVFLTKHPEPPPPAPAPRIKKLSETDFAKSVFDETGVPYELAPWLEAMRTQGMPYFDPPRPIPLPNGGGDLSRQFGLPRWNGLIGGVDGTPNDGTAPRGTLLWCKQDPGNEKVYGICLSQGPENLMQRRAPAQQQPTPAYGRTYSQPYYGQPVYSQPYSQPYYQGNCYGGVCSPGG